MLYESYRSAADAYQTALDHLLRLGDLVDEPVTTSSPSSGKKIIELLGVRLIIAQPHERFIHTPDRPLNIGFAIGNFLYQLSGRDDVEMLEYYNPLAPKFSDNGKYLHGAYGPRIVLQLERVVDMLTVASGSRRAVVTIFDGRIDHAESKDIPCPVFMQFLIRGGAVVMLTYFRSQNVVMVFPYDIFLFTLIHEWVAVHLGLPMGQHVQFCGSLHIYEDEIDLAKRVIQSGPLNIPMAAMTWPDSTEIETMFYFEKKLRAYGQHGHALDDDRVVRPALSPYWHGVVNILHAFADLKRQGHSALRDPLVLAHAWDAP